MVWQDLHLTKIWNKLKSKIFNDKTVYKQKCFSFITKNLNWKILTKNLFTIKDGMGSRMNNLNIMGVHWNIQFLGGFHEKTTKQYIVGEGDCLKRDLGQFAYLRGARWKRECGVFERGVTPQCTLWNQNFNFLGGSFSNRDNVRTPTLFRRTSQPQHLIKRWLFLKNRYILFHINGTSITDMFINIRPIFEVLYKLIQGSI